MAKYAINLSDELNSTLGEGMVGNDDAMSEDSDDAADDTNDVQIVESNHNGSSGLDETCNDKPLGYFDEIFHINYT